MDIDTKGDYLNSETAKQGDIVAIASEGVKADIKRGNEVKQVYNFDVTIAGRKYVYTPGIKALKAFVAAWGKDSKAWIGKTFEVKLVTIEVAGREMNVIRPVIQATHK